jgi:hypothetical protein
MSEIIVHDQRAATALSADVESGSVVFTIAPHTPLADVLSLLAFFCDNHREYRRLTIIAHRAASGRPQLGKEDLGLHNVRRWNALKGRLREIVLHSRPADEILFCAQLAYYSGATVSSPLTPPASDAVQTGEKLFGARPGASIVFSPDGGVSLPGRPPTPPLWQNSPANACAV